MVGMLYQDIPVTVAVKLDSAELIFTTLVAGSPYGEGRKLYHHKDLSHINKAELPTWRFCSHHETVHGLDGDEDHRIDDELEEELRALNLCEYGF